MGKNCVICGEYSGNYPLCRSCNRLKEEGEIVKCEKCETWHKRKEPCNCPNAFQKIGAFFSNLIIGDSSENDEEYEDIESVCIICDEPSNGYLFCRKCYGKYKNKTILLSVKNCKEIKKLKESYSNAYEYICKDGHVVKSKSERNIDDYLFDHHIRHVYEKDIRIDEQTHIHPDFYLPDQDAYIEHWGFGKENALYTKQKEFKLDYYRRTKKTLICTYEDSDSRNIEASLEWKLTQFKKNVINFEEK